MKVSRALIVWLLVVVICLFAISRTRFTADMSAFLPSEPSEQQSLLVELLRDGIASRILLLGIEGGQAEQRAAASRRLVTVLQASPLFAAATNGESLGSEKEQEWLFHHRYLLSDAVNPQHFSSDGLHAAIQNSIDLLTSAGAMLLKPLILHDPTAETLHVLDQLGSRGSGGGLWLSRDGARALLLVTTAADGADTDAQEQAIATLHDSFATVVRELGGGELKLLVSGPGVFAVNARATIKDEVARLSLIGISFIVVLLLIVYRSPRALLLSLLPVITGGLVGVVMVGLVFGQVHGITLGFGIPLIGEAIDYAIYFFVQRERADVSRFWRTIWLGVMTSVCGFGALLLSGFPGLAQVGLFSMSGLLAAVLTTRFVLPRIVPANLAVRDLSGLGDAVMHLLGRARWLRVLPPLAALLAIALLLGRGGDVWNRELGALSPVPDADQELDAALRRDLPAPDVRYLVVISADSADAALTRAEALQPLLDGLTADKAIGGYDSPVRYLPSLATQQQRRDSLPDAATLRERLHTATDDLPLRAARLEPFVDDVEQARTAPLLKPQDLRGTLFETALDAMLIRHGDRWRALLPLQPRADGGALRIDQVRAALQQSDVPGVLFVDIKHESEQLYASYLAEARWAAIGGVLAIVLLLAFALRSLPRLLRLAAPLTSAVLVVIATLVVSGQQLTLLHLVGMLLVVAVGSNYALFFDAGARGRQVPGASTLASLIVANLTTLAGFGILALSTVPVLKSIGIVVGPGALLALLFSAMMYGTRQGRG